jgi:predicted DCC family thiol-disulfide oxidoreductase YuxK
LFVYLNIGRRIRFEPLQSEAGKKLLRRSGRAPDDISSVVLVERERFVYDMFSMSLNLINHN